MYYYYFFFVISQTQKRIIQFIRNFLHALRCLGLFVDDYFCARALYTQVKSYTIKNRTNRLFTRGSSQADHNLLYLLRAPTKNESFAGKKNVPFYLIGFSHNRRH